MARSVFMIIPVLIVGFASAEYTAIESIYQDFSYLSGNKAEYPTNTISEEEAANINTNCKNWLKDSICTEWESDAGVGGKACSTNDASRAGCRKTCGICFSTCFDKPWCRGPGKNNTHFASEVRCMNRAWVLDCPYSCNRCAPYSGTHDALGAAPTSAQAGVPATNCKNWNTDAWCLANAANCNKKNVKLQCKQTCSLCAAPDCDDIADCANWKITSGKCYTYSSKVLLRNCPRSCGWCDGMTTNFDQTSTDMDGNEIALVADPGAGAA